MSSNADTLARLIHTYWTTHTDAADPKFAKPAFPDWVGNAQCGSQQGEYGLLTPIPAGDRVNGVPTAHGAAQWHAARQKVILEQTDIDILTAGSLDQQRAIWWEIKNICKPCYKALVLSRNEREAVTALVYKFEFSKNKPRDVERRTDYALHWKDFFAGAHPA